MFTLSTITPHQPSMVPTYLVVCQLRQQIRIIWKRFYLQTRSIYIDSQELCAVRAKGNLFHAVSIDELQKVTVTDVVGLSVGILLNDREFRRWGSRR
jgi:hypothetical protein